MVWKALSPHTHTRPYLAVTGCRCAASDYYSIISDSFIVCQSALVVQVQQRTSTAPSAFKLQFPTKQCGQKRQVLTEHCGQRALQRSLWKHTFAAP